nr:alpha/beta hydrolase [Arthrobacter sp. Rue61a]
MESGAVSVPTLILWGAHDYLVPRHHQKTVAEGIPGSQLKVYEKTGRLVLWECPERVAET